MSDKNPKHPLKKKKVAAKVNMADHEAVEEAREAYKSKKPADDRRKGTGSCTARSAVRPLSLFRVIGNFVPITQKRVQRLPIR